jgi:hypothetical protein
MESSRAANAALLEFWRAAALKSGFTLLLRPDLLVQIL